MFEPLFALKGFISEMCSGPTARERHAERRRASAEPV